MSQREKAGFSWPVLAVPAGEPFDVGPKARTAASVRFDLPCSITRLACPHVCVPSRCAAVGHPDSLATSFNGLALSPCLLLALDFQSRAAAVGQGARLACNTRLVRLTPIRPSCRLRSRKRSAVPPASREAGVAQLTAGHEEQPLSDVRGADARSRQIGRPDGVAFGFQVSTNKVEPGEASRSANLLAKDDCRAADADVVVEEGPEVPLVSKPALAARRGERLARSRSSPYFSISRPTCET